MDNILLHELAYEFDIEQFPLAKGGVFKPMSINGEVVKDPVINIANLSRLAMHRQLMQGDVRIFYIKDGRAFINDEDVTDCLSEISDFYNLNDTDISFGIGFHFKTNDMLILDEADAGCFVDHFEEFASHLVVDKLDEEDEIVAFHPIHNVVSQGSEVRYEVAYRNAFTVTFSEERREVSNVEINDSLYSFKYE